MLCLSGRAKVPAGALPGRMALLWMLGKGSSSSGGAPVPWGIAWWDECRLESSYFLPPWPGNFVQDTGNTCTVALDTWLEIALKCREAPRPRDHQSPWDVHWAPCGSYGQSPSVPHRCPLWALATSVENQRPRSQSGQKPHTHTSSSLRRTQHLLLPPCCPKGTPFLPHSFQTLNLISSTN